MDHPADTYTQYALGGSMQVWLATAYLVGMFAVLAFAPQQIRRKSLLRLSHVLFAVFILLPAVADTIMYAALAEDHTHSLSGVVRPDSMLVALVVLGHTLARIAFGLSILFGLGALTPVTRYYGPQDRERGRIPDLSL